MADYESRLVTLGMSLTQCIGESFRISAVTLYHMPVPCAILRCIILIVDSVNIGRKLNFVAVIEHYQVTQTQISGYASRTLGDLLLNTAVGYECVCLVLHPVAEAGREETFGDSRADCHRVALAKMELEVFSTPLRIDLGCPGVTLPHWRNCCSSSIV